MSQFYSKDREKLGVPEQLSVEQWSERRNNFLGWMKDNECFIQISYPRSGRVWTCNLVKAIFGKTTIQLNRTPKQDEYKLLDCPYVACHLWSKVKEFVLENLSADIVFLVRDPRDSILSIIVWYLTKSNNRKNYFGDMDFLQAQIVIIRDYYEAILPLSPLIIQYEHLCKHPIRELNKMAGYMDVSIKLSKLAKGHLENPDRYYMEHSLKWQRDDRFTDEYADIVWSGLSDLMLPFGYQRNGHSPNIIH